MNTALTFRGFGTEKKVAIRIQNLGLSGNGARASLTLFGIWESWIHTKSQKPILTKFLSGL